MVNEPFKNVDKSAIDPFTSTLSASQSAIDKTASSEQEVNIQADDTNNVKPSDTSQKSTQNIEHEMKQDK